LPFYFALATRNTAIISTNEHLVISSTCSARGRAHALPRAARLAKKDKHKLQQSIMQSSAPDDGSAALRIADVRHQRHKTELRREKNLAMAWGLARILVSLATNDPSDVACVLAWRGPPRRPKLRRPRVGAAHTRKLRSRPPKRFTRAGPRRCLPSKPSCLLLRVAEMRARALVPMRRCRRV
jgi:hypothetical protein